MGGAASSPDWVARNRPFVVTGDVEVVRRRERGRRVARGRRKVMTLEDEFYDV